MLSQLVYVSNRKSTCTDKEIDSILESCEKNNPGLDVTGVLLYSDTKFLQYVEGEYKILIALLDKIKKDARHDDVVMISLGPLKEKLFPSWHMGNKKITGNELEFRTDISAAEKLLFTDILQGKVEKSENVQKLIKNLF